MTTQLDTTDITTATDALDEARRLYGQFIEEWSAAVDTLRRAGNHVAVQVDAYQPFTRDQGMGYDPEAWFDKVSEALDSEAGEFDECAFCGTPEGEHDELRHPVPSHPFIR